MRSIAAKSLRESLEQARGVGLVEESFTLKGSSSEHDCALVVRNLIPDEYEAIMEECRGFDEMPYLNAFQRGHVSRGIVEINGFDLRDVGFIEDEIPDEKRAGQVKKVKVEKHKWVEKNLVRTWSKEALFTVYRKVGDAIAKAERLSKEGVTFTLPEEAPHDQLRRLLAEVKDLEGEVPVEMLNHIYDDYGLIRKSTQEEYASVDQKLRNLDIPVPEASLESVEAFGEDTPIPTPEPPKPAQESSEAILRRRVPLNQVVPATPPSSEEPKPSRASEYEAVLQSHSELGLGAPPVEVTPPRPPRSEVAEIGPRVPFDPAAALGVIDQPPRAGINPRFRPPGR